MCEYVDSICGEWIGRWNILAEYEGTICGERILKSRWTFSGWKNVACGLNMSWVCRWVNEHVLADRKECEYVSRLTSEWTCAGWQKKRSECATSECMNEWTNMARRRKRVSGMNLWWMDVWMNGWVNGHVPIGRKSIQWVSEWVNEHKGPGGR